MMHKAPVGPFCPLGFVSYDRSASIDPSPSCSGFRSYQGPAQGGGVDPSFSTHSYYAPTLSTTPYIGSIGFRSVVPQQSHFPGGSDPQPFIDYRYHASNQSASLAPTYEHTRYNHMAHAMLDATHQPYRSYHQGPAPSPFLADYHPDSRVGPSTVGTSSSVAFPSHLINPSYSPDGVELLARGTASPTRRHGNILRSPEVEKIVMSGSSYTSSGSSSEVTSRPTTTKKKRPLAVPEEQKDGQYWTRRRKNNDSAKRSRETRRVKAALAETRLKELEGEVERKRTIWKLLHRELKELKSSLSSSTVW